MNLSTFNFNYKNNLILGTIIILLIYISFFFKIEEFSKNTIMKARGSQYEKLQFYGSQKEIALLGTSHTIYARAINNDNFMDYGAPGTFFLEMYYKTLKLVKYAKNLKVLIIEVDDFHFTKFAENFRNKEYAYLYPDQNMTNTSNKFEISDYFYSFNDNVKPIIHKEMLQKIIGKPKKSLHNEKLIEINGEIYPLVMWLDYDKNKRNEDAQFRVKYHKLDCDSNLSIPLISYLEKTIELAQKNGIKVIFIRHPLSDEYLGHINKNMQKKIDTEIQDIAQQYSIDVLDYRFVFNKSPEVFRDQDHLNPLGWNKMSEILLNDITY